MRVRSRSRFLRGDRGETLVEFALASVLFFTTIFGIIEFGLAIWQYNMVADLAQEGARWASVRGKTVTPATHAADVQTFVQGRSVGLSVTVPSPPTSDPATLDAGNLVTVKVQTTFTPLTALIPNATLTLSSTAQMVVAR